MTAQVLHLERTNGVCLYVEVHGQPCHRMPLLLTHGYGSSSAMWRSNLEAIAADRQVVTWDMRGHGRTITPPIESLYTHDSGVGDLAAVLDSCEIETAAVGGLSLGGYLSLALCASRPERVGALVLCDTGPGFRDEDARHRWNSYALGRAEALERDGLAAIGDSPEVRLAKHDPAGLALAARGILTQKDDAVITSLDRINVPTLVVVGADDQLFLAAANYMAAKIASAEMAVVPGAGHACNIDQPELFNATLTEFLHKLDRGDHG
jgi:pimeloyl-ACP methyl ester carboxylesterase